MKKKSDPRHLARRKATAHLFEHAFRKETKADKLTKCVLENLEKIDKIITKSAPAWPIEQIAKVDLAILRLAIYELLFGKTAPFKVIIDEAVELAKEFGSETSPGFVNGVLGTVVKNKLKAQSAELKTTT